MKEPFIDVEEKIDKVVGRRTRRPDALSVKTSSKAHAIAWRESFGGVHVPKGVYRFKTHEEADEWMNRMLTRSQIPKKD